VFYDGYGDNLGNVKNALRLAMNHETFYYFVDTKINQTYQKSHMLRTEVLFGAPLPGNIIVKFKVSNYTFHCLKDVS
jgi:PERQ amino acid-rich with GYF domain-containing protein